MPPRDKRLCSLFAATGRILSLLLPLQAHTLYNRHLLPREIQVDKSKQQIITKKMNKQTKMEKKKETK